MKSKVQTVNRVSYEQVDSIISSDIVLIGDITSGGSLRIEGNIRGSISISGNLIVGRNAMIIGTCKAQNIHIIGTIEGDVQCEQLKIFSTGKMSGDAEIESIIIDEGAVFVGNCKIVCESSKEPDVDEILTLLNNSVGIECS